MEQIQILIEKITNIQTYQVLEVIIAILIFLFFHVFKSTFAFIIIKAFKIKEKNKKRIKNNAFYIVLKRFFTLLGLYLSILFLRQSFDLDEYVTYISTKIFRIAIIILFANGLANSIKIKSTFIEKIKERMDKDIDDTMLNFILKIVRCIIYIIAGFLVMTELGFSNLNGIITGLGLGGVVITLAAQDTAKNLFGGFVIFIDKPFIVGDWIQMDPYEGTVEDITFRSTRIRTFENSVVNVPNSILSNSSIINWSKMEKRRYKFDLTIELETPLNKLESLKKNIEEMLKKHEDVIDDSIIVKFDEITERGINILVYVYTNSVDYTSFLNAKENINYKIMQILEEEHIKLAYDTKTVYVRN